MGHGPGRQNSHHKRKQENHRRGPADLQRGMHQRLRGEMRPGTPTQRRIEGARDHQPEPGDQQQPRADLTNGLMEHLLLATQTTEEKTHPETEKEVSQHRPQDGGLDDNDHIAALILAQQDHKQDDFDDGAEGGLDEHAEDLWQLLSQLAAGEAQQIGRGNHGDVVEGEDDHVQVGAGEMEGDRGGHERPQDIDQHRERAGALEADEEEVQRMDAASPALAGGAHPKQAPGVLAAAELLVVRGEDGVIVCWRGRMRRDQLLVP